MALGQAGSRGVRRSDRPALARGTRLPVLSHPDRLPELPRPRPDGLSLRPRHANLLHRQGHRGPDRGDGRRPGGRPARLADGAAEGGRVRAGVLLRPLRHRLERVGEGATHEPADREGAARPALGCRRGSPVRARRPLVRGRQRPALRLRVSGGGGGDGAGRLGGRYLRIIQGPPRRLRQGGSLPLVIKTTAPLGIPRLLASGEESLPKRLAQERGAIYNGTRHLYAVADESAMVQKSVAEATDAAPSLGERPLVALSAGARQYPGFTKKQAKRADEQANEFEAGLINLSENSELVVAKNSEHYIQFDRPG